MVTGTQYVCNGTGFLYIYTYLKNWSDDIKQLERENEVKNYAGGILLLQFTSCKFNFKGFV